MKQIASWNELFSHWRREASKYAALKKLRDFYDSEKDKVNEPFQRKLLEHVEKHGRGSLSADVRDALYSEVREQVVELRKWHDRMTKEIVDYYDQGNRK